MRVYMTRLLQWLTDDERLKPREKREVHPIPDAPPLPLEQRVHHLECYFGMLWDQVWWMQLPLWKRTAFRLLGFKAPIQQFYIPPKD